MPDCPKVFRPQCLRKAGEKRKETKDKNDSWRGSAARRGYGHKWRKARLRYLQQHPLCRRCQEDGYLTAANVVDHIVPHKGDMKLFWDLKNWQPLCKQCHDRKTAKEDGGFGNKSGLSASG